MMKERPVQFFSDDYLARCAAMTPDQILAFLEQFRLLHAPAVASKSRLISMKVDETLLGAFRTRCTLRGVPYQTQIKRLMADWMKRS